jgi:TRAP-type C4-dicarboxylate transport system permease small subunit
MIAVGPRRTPAMSIPYAYMYASILFSFGLIAVYEFRNLLADIRDPGLPPADNQKLLDFLEE